MSQDKTADYLVQEYLFLQKAIEDFDGRALTIKAWSVTFSAGGLGLAYQQNNRTLLLIAAFSALVFWLTEAVWKYHQRAFYPRVREIEAWFAKNQAEGDDAPFQIMSNWRTEVLGGTVMLSKPPELDAASARRAARKRAYAVPFFAGVMLPHVVVFLAGIALYVFLPPADPPVLDDAATGSSTYAAKQ